MTGDELWKTLRVGDQVRVVEFPREFLKPGALQEETRLAYEYLVRRRHPLTVSEIDDWGLPYVKFRLRDKDGRIERHYMALNHSGLMVVSRKSE